jgi:hypothetical protein
MNDVGSQNFRIKQSEEYQLSAMNMRVHQNREYILEFEAKFEQCCTLSKGLTKNQKSRSTVPLR